MSTTKVSALTELTTADANDVLLISDVSASVSKKIQKSNITQENFTTTLKNKLDGIEASATADQTAQEIATAIDADATAEATLKSALGLGTAAYTASTDYATAAHNHAGVYEPADATILKDADIGVNVQAYNANLVTYATNGNTAYGWGNHASAGYLTSETYTGTVTSVAATAGTGISISGSPITSSGILTITNTAPDQTVSLTQGGATTISGTYPNFTISSTDTNTTYSAGSGLDLTGTTFSVEPDLRDGITHVGLDIGDFISWSNNAYTSFYVNGAEDWRMVAGGAFHADGDVIAYSATISDERLKTDIKTIDNALDMVNNMRGVTFTYKKDGKQSAGVVAQELEKIFPRAISETQLPLKADDDKEYKVVQYDQLHGVLIEAIKELTARVKELESK